MRKRKKSCNWIVVLILILLLSISIGYSALSSTLSIGGLVTISLPQVYPVKYAVQIYGINQDVDADGNPLGLTFGPATEFELNNAYITHTYEETSPGSNIYNVVRVLHHVAANNTETYFTWIPRYEYKILADRPNLATDNRRIDVNFITTSTTNSNCTPGYAVPEAFWWDNNGNGTQDEGEQLTGYWMTKYQLNSN